MTHHEINIALFNFEHGGLRRPGVEDSGLRHASGYAFDGLINAFADDPLGPDILVLNEAKGYADGDGGIGQTAVNLLAEHFHRVYEIRVAPSDRGPFGPAVIYDPILFRLDGFGGWHQTVQNKRGVASFSLRAKREVRFRVAPQHFDFADGDRRLAEARLIQYLADPAIPTLVAGDLNSIASGPHMRQRDWMLVPEWKRSHKAWQPGGPGTEWVADTRAVDALIGAWVDDRPPGVPGVREIRRSGGFRALNEVALVQGMALHDAMRATTNVDDGLIIDWLLVNEPWFDALVPGSYRVHVPRSDPPSDHRLVTATLRV